MSFRRTSAVLAASAAVLAAVALTPATAFAAGPPAAATAFKSAIVTPEGGSVTGFGITATFAPGAVTSDRLIVLGNWPNGLDVTPPAGTAVKTFGLQECNTDYTGCTSVFGVRSAERGARRGSRGRGSRRRRGVGDELGRDPDLRARGLSRHRGRVQ